jgi:hypothetical protein
MIAETSSAPFASGATFSGQAQLYLERATALQTAPTARKRNRVNVFARFANLKARIKQRIINQRASSFDPIQRRRSRTGGHLRQ